MESGAADTDTTLLVKDRVAAIAVEYRQLQSTNESLIRLNEIMSVRAELSWLGLARTYVSWCVDHDGSWESGFKYLWWTKRQLLRAPVLQHPSDLINNVRLPFTAQEDLAKWSTLTARLIFLSDIGHHAPMHDPVRSLVTLPEEAAKATGEPSFGKLMRWLARSGVKIVERAYPRARFEALLERLSMSDDEGMAPRQRRSSGKLRRAHRTAGGPRRRGVAATKREDRRAG